MRNALLFLALTLAVLASSSTSRSGPGFAFADEGFAGVAQTYDASLQRGRIDPLLSREIHNAWVFRQDVRLRFASGLSVGGWQSVALEHPSATPDIGDEGHIELGYRGEVCDTEFVVSTGMHNMSGPGDRFEQQLEWGVARLYTAADETWELKMRAAWISPTTFSDGVAVVQPYVVSQWSEAFGLSRATLRQSFTVSWDDGFEAHGIKNKSRGIFFRYETEVAWKLNEHTSLVLPKFVGLFPLRAGHDGRGEEWELSGGLEYKF